MDRGAGLDVSVKPPGADTLPKAKRIDRGRGYALGVAAAGPNRVAAAWIAAPRVSRNARVRYEGTRRIGTVGRDARGERRAGDRFRRRRGRRVGGGDQAQVAPRRGLPRRGCAVRPVPVRFAGDDLHGLHAGHDARQERAAAAAAIAPDGTVTVVWEQGVGLRFARATNGKFGRSKVLAPRTGKREDSSAKTAAQRDGSVVVVYEFDADVRTVTLSPTGKPTKPVTLGEGSFGHDSVRVAPDGTLAVCCLAAPNTPPSVAVYRGAWQLLPVADLGENDEIETVYANATSLILGLIDVHSAGDLGPTGIPGSRVTGENNVFLAPIWAKVSKPTRGLEPGVAIDRDGHSVLVYQEKTGPQAFSRAAPVYASVAGGPARS